MNNHAHIIDFLTTSASAKKLELNVNAVDGDKCTMLHHAARKGALEALKKILERNPDLIYGVDIGLNTALHYASMNGTLLTI
jgi:ankyrin repeat protein